MGNERDSHAPTPGRPPAGAAAREVLRLALDLKPEGLERALRKADAALARNPDDVALWVAKGNVLDVAGRYAEGLACYRRALALDPRCLSARLDVANHYEWIDEPHRAESEYADLLDHILAHHAAIDAAVEEVFESIAVFCGQHGAGHLRDKTERVRRHLAEPGPAPTP